MEGTSTEEAKPKAAKMEPQMVIFRHPYLLVSPAAIGPVEGGEEEEDKW